MTERLEAAELCTRLVTMADAAMSVTDAARLMREQHVGCLVVVERTERGPSPVGLLTDRDIVTAVVARGLDAAMLRVGDVMTTDLVVAHEHDSLIELIALMHRNGVRRVPVVTRTGTLVGVTALDDLLVALSRQLSELAQTFGAERRREQNMRA